MKDLTYQEISISEISTAPTSPRRNIPGVKFDELVASIREKGIIEPVILRPLAVGYEVVAGVRRFMAAHLIAVEDKSLTASTVPAIIKDLSDAEAFEIMIIENLQREDLTPFEEAHCFRRYCETKGRGSVIELAKRIGLSPGYIRRKIAVLSLPNEALKAWEKEKIQFSHLEQLRRLKNKKDMKEAIDYAIGKDWHREGMVSKRALKQHIDEKTMNLENALFDIGPCGDCGQNSEVQKKDWDTVELKGAHCLDQTCFKSRQNGYLTSSWKQTKDRKRFGTNGFRFQDSVSWSDHETFGDWGMKPAEKCKTCKSFLSILDVDGSINQGKACFGDKKCYQQIGQEKKKKEKAARVEKGEPEGPRVEWHGEHFREEFLSKALPERYRLFGHADIKMARMGLFAFVKLDNVILNFMAREIKLKESYSDKKLFERIGKMKLDEIQELTQKCALKVIMRHYPVTCEGRLAVATHIGINLAKEFAVTKDYLEKKTISEMLDFGEKSGIFADKKAKARLAAIARKKYSSCKKTELIDVFLKSGVKLVGKVPDEIIPTKERK